MKNLFQDIVDQTVDRRLAELGYSSTDNSTAPSLDEQPARNVYSNPPSDYEVALHARNELLYKLGKKQGDNLARWMCLSPSHAVRPDRATVEELLGPVMSKYAFRVPKDVGNIPVGLCTESFNKAAQMLAKWLSLGIKAAEDASPGVEKLSGDYISDVYGSMTAARFPERKTTEQRKAEMYAEYNQRKADFARRMVERKQELAENRQMIAEIKRRLAENTAAPAQAKEK